MLFGPVLLPDGSIKVDASFDGRKIEREIERSFRKCGDNFVKILLNQIV